MPTWIDIVNDNTSAVLNAANRVLGNVSDAEDVTQEVFAEAFRKFDASSAQNWTGLLRRLAVCRAIDLLRSRKTTEPLSPLASDGKCNGPVEDAMTRELKQRLRIETAKLPSRESQVFCLVYYEQLGHSDVARILGISQTAVTSALSKARAKLGQTLFQPSTGECK